MNSAINGHSPLHDAASYMLAYPLDPSLSQRRRSPDTKGERAARVVLAAWLMKGFNGRALGPAMAKRNAFDGKIDLPKKEYKAAASCARLHLLEDGRSLDLRMAYLRLIMNRVTSPKVVFSFMLRAGFAACEAQTYLDLLEDEELWEGVKEAIEAFAAEDVRADLTFSPAVVRQQAVELRALAAQAAKAVRYKLRFIVQSNAFEYGDLENDLFKRAISRYYFARPYMSRAHALGYARAALSSGVQDAISYWTNPDRARLRETAGGWESTVVAFDSGDFDLLNSKDLSAMPSSSKKGSGTLGSTFSLIETNVP